MRKFFLSLLFSWASFYVITTDVQAQSVLITYNNEQELQEINTVLSTNSSFEVLEGVSVITANVTDDELIELNALSPQLNIEQDLPIELLDEQLATSETSTTPWNLQTLNVWNAWDNNYTGKNVKVAIIDTGINKIDPLTTVKKSLSFNTDVESTKINEADLVDRGHENMGHGTSVASIISSKAEDNSVQGIASDVELYSLKYTDGTKKGELSNLVKAINWAIENQMDIINISSGLTSDVSSLHNAVKKAVNKNILVVASAGNDGQLTPAIYPARYEEVISVGAINKYMDISSFSNAAEAVTFTAPGESIATYSQAGNPIVVSGTSFAAPHITAFLAILKERYPYSTSEFIVKKAQEQVKNNNTPYFKLTQPVLVNDKPTASIVKLQAHQAALSMVTENSQELLISLNGQFITRTTKNTFTFKNLKANQNYAVTIRALNAKGDWSNESKVTFKTKQDVTPPQAPSNLSAFIMSSGKITLNWQQIQPSDFSKTIIYENGVKIATTKNKTFTTSKLKKNQQYEYKVVSVDTTGNRSTAKKIKVILYK